MENKNAQESINRLGELITNHQKILEMNNCEAKLIVDIIEKLSEVLNKKRTELLTIKLVLMMQFIISGAFLFWNGLPQQFAIGYAMFIAACAFLLFSNEG